MSTREGDSIIERPTQEGSLGERIRENLRRLERDTLGQEAARSTLPTVEQALQAEGLQRTRAREIEESNRTLEALKEIIPIAAGRANELLLGLSPLTGYKEMFEIASSTSPGEVGEVFQALARGDFQESDEALGDILSRSPTARRQQALRESFAGGTIQGLGEALLSTAELPGELIEDLPEDFRQKTDLDDLAQGIFWATDKSRAALQKFAQHQDQLAMAFGASPEDVIGAKVTGGFVGFTPVIFGSFKAAELFPFARGAGFRPFALRDLTAGSIMGVAATEGDLEERFNAAKTEAAFFGAWSLGLAGLGLPLKAFRQRRMLQKLQESQLKRLVEEVEEAWDPNRGVLDLRNLDGATGRAVFEVLSEEQALAQSGRAREVVSRTADERALVPAIMDLAEGEASHGIIRGVKNPDEMLETLENAFPDLSFEVAKRPGSADIVFGRGKLGDTVMKRFTSEGRVPGQRILVGGQEMEYVGRLQEGRVRARWIDSGEEVPGGVPEELVSDLPFATIGEPSKEVKELVDEFVDMFFRRVEQVVRNSDDLTEEQVVQAAREGRLAEMGLSLRAERDVPMEGVIGSKFAVAPEAPEIRPERVAEIIAEEGFETFHPLRPAAPATFRELVQQFADSRGLVQERIVGAVAQVKGQEFVAPTHAQAMNKAAERLGLSLDEINLGRGSAGQSLFKTSRGRTVNGEEAERIAANAGQLTEEALANRAPRPDDDVLDSMRRKIDEGADLDELSDAEREAFRFQFMGARGLRAEELKAAESEVVVDALQAEAARVVRQRMWEMVPKEQKRLLKELRMQVLRNLEDRGPSLERDAALAGFNVRRLEGGRVELRETNTGLGAEFRNEEAAREALKGVERRVGHNVGRNMFPRFSDETPFTSHLPPIDDFMLTGREEPGQVLEMLVSNPKWRNLRTWAQQVEERTGLPMWSQVFEPLDELKQRYNNAAEPWAKRILGLWKGLSREERAALDPFWQAIAGKQLSQAEMIGIGQRLGLSGKQVRTALKALEIERALFTETDLPRFRYLENHFARIRPQVSQEGRLPERVADLIPEDLPQQAEQFWQKARTNELAQREKDPLLVQLKYARSVLWEQHMRSPWERARAFIGSRSREGTPPDEALEFGMRNLTPNQRARIVNTFGDMEGVRQAHRVLKEYLGRARGYPSAGRRNARRFFTRLVNKLDIDIEEAVMEDLTNSLMSLMYGAAMAGRPQMLARNLSQNLWFSWMRLDSGVIGRALKRAMSGRSGWDEPLNAGAIRPQQRGVFAGEAVFEARTAEIPMEGELGQAKRAAIRGALQAGESVSNLSRLGMVPFGSSDDFNRSWAYWAQKMHTQKYLERLKRGDIDEATFINEGLRGHTATTRREFARRFDLLGEEEALRYIGKQHADEAHFVYARSHQPLWLQGDVGKFGGMFGTYSLWAKDYLWHTLGKNLTPGQMATAFAKGAAFGSAIFLVGEEMGFDLNNWLSPLSAFTFTGGPITEVVLGVRDIMSNATWAPETIPAAVARLGNEQARLSWPFQGLQHDIWQAGERAQTLDQQILGVILGTPERSKGNYFMDMMIPFEDDVTTPKDQVLDAVGVTGNP